MPTGLESMRRSCRLRDHTPIMVKFRFQGSGFRVFGLERKKTGHERGTWLMHDVIRPVGRERHML